MCEGMKTVKATDNLTKRPIQCVCKRKRVSGDSGKRNENAFQSNKDEDF